MSTYATLYFSQQKHNEEQVRSTSSDAFQAKDAYKEKKQSTGMQRKQPLKSQMQEGGGDREEVVSASQAKQISETLRSL
jgi:hypothetical protein